MVALFGVPSYSRFIECVFDMRRIEAASMTVPREPVMVYTSASGRPHDAGRYGRMVASARGPQLRGGASALGHCGLALSSDRRRRRDSRLRRQPKRRWASLANRSYLRLVEILVTSSGNSFVSDVVHLRLVRHELAGPRGAAALASPLEVTGRLLAVQPQDFPASKWALGVRSPGTTVTDVEVALNCGLIVRS